MNRASFETRIGRCALSWTENGLTGFELPGAPVTDAEVGEVPQQISRIIQRVQEHLAGHAQDFSDLEYDFSRLPTFTVAVLKATLAVKSGETRSYGQIAAALNQPTAVSRAVGAALGSNPWPLLIPCHRIVAANGKMTGFSGPGGVKAKTRLLALEGAQLISE
jgi:methylated-DNA-[protein]-cysteine S-methyltransferase